MAPCIHHIKNLFKAAKTFCRLLLFEHDAFVVGQEALLGAVEVWASHRRILYAVGWDGTVSALRAEARRYEHFVERLRADGFSCVGRRSI